MPPKTSKEKRERIVELRREDPDTWSHRKIAKEVGVSKYVVWETLNEAGMTGGGDSANGGGDADGEADAGGDGVSELTPDPPTGAGSEPDAVDGDSDGDDDDVVRVPCDKCGGEIPLTEKHVSQTIKCPHCDTKRLVRLRE